MCFMSTVDATLYRQSNRLFQNPRTAGLLVLYYLSKDFNNSEGTYTSSKKFFDSVGYRGC